MKTYEEYLEEAKAKPVVFTFGRFNPVTNGHEIAVNDIIKKAKGGTPMIFTSQSQDPKKNPLSYNDKTKYLKKFWGKMIVKNTSIKTAFDALKWLSDQGYKDVTLVVGSDRVAKFTKYITPYIKHKDPSKSYDFDKFEVVQAGAVRGKGNEMSASRMREAAKEGDYDFFRKGVPSMCSEKDAKGMYDAVRKGMGIREQVSEYLEFGTDLTTKKYKKWTPGQSFVEEITSVDLKQVEAFADKIFAKVGIDVEFTRHFLERANDKRNGKQINVAELIRLFKETYKKHGKNIPKLGTDAQAVLNDTQTDLNLPFVLKWDKKAEEFDLVSKTIMRKKDFKTSNPKLKV